MAPSSPQHGGVTVHRRPFLAGVLATVVAPGVVSLPAATASPTPLERAVAEVRASRLAELRHFGSRTAAERTHTGTFVLRTLRAVARLRDAATAEGLTYAQYRAALDLALRRGRRDYLKEMPRSGPRLLAA